MTILCLSGSRADYGYLAPIAQALDEEVTDLSVLTHGRDAPESIATRAGIFGATVAERLARTRPRMMVVVGDRWEILSACQAAVLASVPVAHIGAGEITTGAYDQKFRCAIAQLADLHVALHEGAYTFLSGGSFPYVTLAGCTSVQAPAEVPQGNGTAILALYPETRGDDLSSLSTPIEGILIAHGLKVVRIGSNPDVSASRFPGDSLPLDTFHKALVSANIIVGNSSAGIIEAPILCTPAVNIGYRQNGRPRAPGVFQADPEITHIAWAIERALAYGKQRIESPYYRVNAVQIIVNAIRSYLEVTRDKAA